MPDEPNPKRAIAFIDGQNLFHAAKEAFGYTFPNYDIKPLVEAVCTAEGWKVQGIRFYTGIPGPTDRSPWRQFWAAKLLSMSRQGILVYSRPLRYRNKTVDLPDGSTHAFMVREEKGIDVRIAIDMIRLAHQRAYDVALVFSQDQDLSEAVDEVHTISREQDRWIKAACAFPDSPVTRNHRGINKTDWKPIDRASYDACLDPKTYGLPTRP